MITRIDAEERLKKAWERFNMPTSNPFYFAVQTLVEDIRQDMYATIEDAFYDGYEWGWIDSLKDSKYRDKERFEDWLDRERTSGIDNLADLEKCNNEWGEEE